MRTDALLVLVKLEDLRIKHFDTGSGFRRSAIEVYPLRDISRRKLVVGNYQLTFRAKSQKVLKLCYFYAILTYLLTPWCRVLLEKLTCLQLVKKFPAFHGTRRFITALTSARHLSLYWASPIQSIYSHSTSWRSVLILSTHLCIGLPSGLFPSGFPTKTLSIPSPHPYSPHA